MLLRPQNSYQWMAMAFLLTGLHAGCRSAPPTANEQAAKGSQANNAAVNDESLEIVRRPLPMPNPRPLPMPVPMANPMPAPMPQTPAPAPVAPRIKLGVSRANYVWESNIDSRLNEINQMAGIGVKLLRTDMRETANIDKLVAVVKRAASMNIKVLLNIMQTAEDYTDPNQIFGSWVPGQSTSNPTNKAFKDVCGWEGGAYRVSTVDVELYRKRIVAYLEAFRRNGLTNVVAYEVGNEYDLVCFNGDLEAGKPTDPNKLGPTLVKYGLMLKTAYQTIKSYYPQATVVSQGLSNMYMRVNHSMIYSSNFLEWSRYAINEDIYAKYCDAIGTHLYPDKSQNQDWYVDTIFKAMAPYVPSGKKYWVTEMGYPLRNFPNNNDSQRFTALKGLVDAVNRAKNYNVEYAIVYSFNVTGETFNIFDTVANRSMTSSGIFKYFPY